MRLDFTLKACTLECITILQVEEVLVCTMYHELYDGH